MNEWRLFKGERRVKVQYHAWDVEQRNARLENDDAKIKTMMVWGDHFDKCWWNVLLLWKCMNWPLQVGRNVSFANEKEVGLSILVIAIFPFPYLMLTPLSSEWKKRQLPKVVYHANWLRRKSKKKAVEISTRAAAAAAAGTTKAAAAACFREQLSLSFLYLCQERKLEIARYYSNFFRI